MGKPPGCIDKCGKVRICPVRRSAISNKHTIAPYDQQSARQARSIFGKSFVAPLLRYPGKAVQNCSAFLSRSDVSQFVVHTELRTDDIVGAYCS